MRDVFFFHTSHRTFIVLDRKLAGLKNRHAREELGRIPGSAQIRNAADQTLCKGEVEGEGEGGCESEGEGQGECECGCESEGEGKSPDQTEERGVEFDCTMSAENGIPRCRLHR